MAVARASSPDRAGLESSAAGTSSRQALAYAVAFFGFISVPVAFRTQAPWPFPTGVYWQEAIDLFTPIVLIPLSWILCALDRDSSRRARILFLVLAAVWVEGQVMHLAANSIGRPFEQAPSPAGDLAHFYDEVLSHYLWHIGIDGLWALAIVRSLRGGAEPVDLRLAVPAMAILGLTWFLAVVESGTAPLDIPFLVAALVYVLTARRQLRTAPVAATLAGSFALSLALMAGWAIMWGGRLPQFTEVGWL